MSWTQSINDITCSSKRLCSQVSTLYSNLQQSQNDLSAAIHTAEASVSKNCIVALLAMVQCVKRDVNNDYRPITSDEEHGSALNEMADLALVTLTELYAVGEAYLKSYGWYPIDQSTIVSGAIVYEHHVSGEVSEEPNVEMSWMMKLILSIPVLIEPGSVEGEVVWAASVVYFYHGTSTNENTELVDLEWVVDDDSSKSSCISVIDVLKSDEDGQYSRLRGIYNGCWRGLYADAMGEMDTKSTLGQHLELWTETTLAGLCTNKPSSQILVIGLAGGQLVSFLEKYMDVQLTIVEESQKMVDIATNYYELPSFMLQRVSVVDLNEYVRSQCLKENHFDTILVNLNTGDEPFPTNLLNSDFFNGLVSMLSSDPTATLLVNSGTSVDTIYNLVNESCKTLHGHRAGHPLILREYMLRDHAENENEGTIIAARRRQWSISVQDWQHEHMGENAQLSGAMDVAHAQQTQVVRIPKFLSSEEIESIHAVARMELASMNKGIDVHTESWKVLYLQNNNLFQQKLPSLRQRILDTIRSVDRENWQLFTNVDHVNIRVVEYHQMDEYGELSDPKHYDLNSLLTMDIMLSNEKTFEGGHLQTYEADSTLKTHTFQQGDALIFVSHKYHCVSRVKSGRRNVLVLEFWYGPERQCPHRCERYGREICHLDPGQEAYTRQYHSASKYGDNEDKSSAILLPFRLGSVSENKEGEREVLQLLWEPNGSDEEVAATQVASPACDNVEKNAALSGAFACFGSDSDEEDVPIHSKLVQTPASNEEMQGEVLSDAFDCFGSDSDE